MAIEPLQSIGTSALRGLGSTETGSSDGIAAGGVSFDSILSEARTSMADADRLAEELATGELTDVAQFTTAAAKAQLAVELTAALRNQALQAYQEIMRMQL